MREDTVEAVPGAPDGDDVARIGGVFLDLVAEPADVDGDGAAVAVAPPHALEQLLAAEHLSGMLDEHAKQLELAGGHPHRLARERHLVGIEVDLEPTEAQPCSASGAGAAQDSLDARDDLCGCGRLDDVVVGAEAEPADLVGVSATRAEKQDGDLGGGADLAAELEARPAGEHDVEQHAVRGCSERVDGVIRVDCVDDAKAVCLEVIAYQRRDLGLVFDDEHEWADRLRGGVHDDSVAHEAPSRLRFRGFFATCSRGRRRLRLTMEAMERNVALAALAALALLVSACGATPTRSGSKATGKYATALAYSRCMRSHGVPRFPDPKQGPGGIEVGSAPGVDPRSPLFVSAQRACRHLLPNGGRPTRPGQQRALARMLRNSQCMRAHGISGFPDPTLSPPANRAGHSAIMSNGVAWLAVPSSIDVRSPAVKRAAAACNLELP